MKKVDKQNGNVKYNDEEHLYWNDDGKFISVTTLIGRYEQPFDEDFWSGYKALEKLLTKEQFKFEKPGLLQTQKINLPYMLDAYEFSEDEFNAVKQDILDEWQRSKIESCERGTKIHSKMENLFLDKKKTDLKKYGIGGKFDVNTNQSLEDLNKDLLDIDKGVFPEYLVYRVSEDKKFKLAGQIDLLIKDGNDIYIVDYKTNKSIDEKSYFDNRTKKNKMMQYPLNNLMDCNKMHYTLQLSTYAWMLQQLNPEFNIKHLWLVHFDHNGGETQYELEYLKDDVERMCRDYKRQIVLEERARNRKPIEF
jgi:ATP-dependent exoDNAse (exonuclease V) beta subunit